MTTNTAPWSDTIKKEARGTNDYDLGEVQDTGTYYVHTQRGIEHRTQFYIPKKLFKNYDGHTVHFDVDEADANQFIGKKYPSDEEYRAKYEPQPKETPAIIPGIASGKIILINVRNFVAPRSDDASIYFLSITLISMELILRELISRYWAVSRGTMTMSS